MLALFGNLSLVEIAVFGVVAILVFGKNLPDVAGDAARKLGRLRRTLEDLRRESGIDAEMNEVRRSLNQGLDQPIRPREVAGTVKQKALDAVGLGAEERRQLAENDPRKVFGSLREDVAQAGAEPAGPEQPLREERSDSEAGKPPADTD